MCDESTRGTPPNFPAEIAETLEFVSGFSQTTTFDEASMDVDLESKTSEGTQDITSADQGNSRPQQKASSSANQSQPKARVRSRKKDVNDSGGQDDSKRRCVSTACIGMCPSILYNYSTRHRNPREDPLLTDM